MASKESGTTVAEIEKNIKSGKFAPVYCFMGEEDYYIDYLSQLLIDCALKPEERDFNQDVLYGADVKASDVASVARQFPMMADRRLVVVREFQAMSDKEGLAAYVKNPCPTTILVLCHKHGKLDGRKPLAQELKSNGVLFESKRLYDNQLPAFVKQYMQRHNVAIEEKANIMLCDHVGSDLSRLVAEMDKLLLALREGDTRVGVELVEEQTGMSKDFNVFELTAALATRDILKANKIVKYFDSSPRSFDMQPTLAVLFNFFSDVLLAYYAPAQTDEAIAEHLGKNLWVARQALIPARRNYSGRKVVEIIDVIRQIDGKSKGVGGVRISPGDLLRELIYFILH